MEMLFIDITVSRSVGCEDKLARGTYMVAVRMGRKGKKKSLDVLVQLSEGHHHVNGVT